MWIQKEKWECMLRKTASLENENWKLNRDLKAYQQLDSFISWLNSVCLNEKKQICGLKKIAGDPLPPCYIGFLMENKLVLEPKSHYAYSIFGYSSLYRNFGYPVYQANLRLELSEIPIGITSEMHLQDNYIIDQLYQHKGIGSAGLDIAKELAKHLHCQTIWGIKVPKKNTKEEMAKLTAFYGANGFQQSEGDKVIFDMSTYVPPHTDEQEIMDFQ